MTVAREFKTSTGWTDGMERFVAESNRIEGIDRTVHAERAAHQRLWSRMTLAVSDVEEFVLAVANARIRDREGMNVRVGHHYPPPGGPRMRPELSRVLELAPMETPYRTHVAYERLHPFMDGNGRSGRAIWAWQMMRSGRDPFALGFLHTFYYQTLDASREP